MACICRRLLSMSLPWADIISTSLSPPSYRHWPLSPLLSLFSINGGIEIVVDLKINDRLSRMIWEFGDLSVDGFSGYGGKEHGCGVGIGIDLVVMGLVVMVEMNMELW